MDFLQVITDFLPAGSGKIIIGATLLALVSVVAQYTKTKLKLESDKIVTFVVTCFAFLSAAVPEAIEYLGGAAAANPRLLGQHTLTYLGALTLLYRYIIKPGSKFITDVKAYNARKKRVAESPVLDSPALAPALVSPQTAPVAASDTFGS